MSGEPQDFTPEELQALEELIDLSESDPALYESIVSEGVAEAQHQEHGEALLGMFENAERRQEQDRALLDALFRAEPSGAEGAQDTEEEGGG